MGKQKSQYIFYGACGLQCYIPDYMMTEEEAVLYEKNYGYIDHIVKSECMSKPDSIQANSYDVIPDSEHNKQTTYGLQYYIIATVLFLMGILFGATLIKF